RRITGRTGPVILLSHVLPRRHTEPVGKVRVPGPGSRARASAPPHTASPGILIRPPEHSTTPSRPPSHLVMSQPLCCDLHPLSASVHRVCFLPSSSPGSRPLDHRMPVSLSIVLYLLLVIALPLALSAAVSFRTLPEGRNCPLCGGQTLRLRARWLAAVSLGLRRSVLHRRWCLTCGWEGSSKMPRERTEPETPLVGRAVERRRPSI